MRGLIVALTLVGIASPSLSQTMTVCTINRIRTGWNADSFAVETVEPIANPAGCHIPDGYISDKSFEGYNTYYAAALTAFTASSLKVVVTTDNKVCFAERPKLIGISLAR